MYLIDTNIVSEARRGSVEAVAWPRSVNPLSVYLSVIMLGEVMRGVAMKQRTDPRAAARLAQWLQTLRSDHADRILPVTDAIALEWGRIAALRPRGDADGLITATAIVHDLIVVTPNVADFEDARATILNPWETT